MPYGPMVDFAYMPTLDALHFQNELHYVIATTFSLPTTITAKNDF
jgi:hypothetical protein